MTTANSETKVWYSPKDLNKEHIDFFYDSEAPKYPKTSNKMRVYSSGGINSNAIYHKAMVNSLNSEITKISKYISIDFAAFLTDELGGILDIHSSSPDVKKELDKVELEVGKNFTKEEFGMNAVSLAMEMNTIGVVKEREHTNPLFFDWNCVCSPLYIKGIPQGYVDISFYKGQQIELAIPLILQIAENVSGKWMLNNSELQLLKLELSFDEYKLTGREKDVAHMWLTEKSALYISNELGISEGTVRNIVKSIYNKMNVTDRLQFIRKLFSDSSVKQLF